MNKAFLALAVVMASSCGQCLGQAAHDAVEEAQALGAEPTSWQGEQERYERVKKWAASQPAPTIVSYRKSPSELWVYDARPELGTGMHGPSARSFAAARKLGVRFVRVTMYWNMAEPESPGKYDRQYMAHWDEVVAAAKRSGIELVVVVHQNPSGVSWSSRKRAYHRFASFVADMAGRYPGVRYWELWNEMNVAFTDLFGAGVPGVTQRAGGQAYAEMLRLAYPAIKKANPNAWVVFGGVAADWREFLDGAYEAGGRDYFDVMNIHSYGVPINWGVAAKPFVARSIMRKYGDETKPIWITEFGIDAGNLVNAWGFEHDRGGSDGGYFDGKHMEQIMLCVDDIRAMGIYAKYMPYQFDAGNESGPAELRTKEYAEKYLPAGMTIDDYGFGFMRRDGRTPRPIYDRLLREQVNRSISDSPVRTVDVTIDYDGYVPIGLKHLVEGGKLTIMGVKVDSAVPSVIRMEKAK